NGHMLETWRPGSVLRRSQVCPPPWRRLGVRVLASLPGSKSSRRCGKTPPRSSLPRCCPTSSGDSRRRRHFRSELRIGDNTYSGQREHVEVIVDDGRPTQAVGSPADLLLSIGVFARRSRLSMKALRLYDRLGLLKPADIDPASGYRRYRESQLATARLVVMLRRLDMPLAQVA